MRNTKLIVSMALTLSACLGIGVASAADLAARPYTKAPPPALVAAYDWSGFYIGADVGYGWATSRGTAGAADGSFPIPYSYEPRGVIGGGYLGGNYQIKNVVLGIEADWQAADLNGGGNFLLGASTYHFQTKIRDYGSVRGRLGLAMDRWMVFGTAGVAWGSWDTSYAFLGVNPFFTNRVNEHAGWTAGGGVEYAFTNNWLARAEYRHTDLGSSAFVAGSGTVKPNLSEVGNRVMINDVRVGIAYKFGAGSVVARY
jgi:outer membrane immunogenic protein